MYIEDGCYTKLFFTDDANIFNDGNYRDAYISDVSNDIAPFICLPAEWFHILYMPHRNINGYGCQVAVSLNGEYKVLFRCSHNAVWDPWAYLYPAVYS